VGLPRWRFVTLPVFAIYLAMLMIARLLDELLVLIE
jgi:hypothetical protein